MKYTEKEVFAATSGITTVLVVITFGSFGGIILSPLVLLWFGFSLFIKVLLTCCLLFFVFTMLCKVWKKLQQRAVEDLNKDEQEQTVLSKTKSKFQERLEELAKERGININK